MYDHLIAIAFTVKSNDRDGEDITPEMLYTALMKRAADLNLSPGKREWVEASLPPIETIEIDDGPLK